MTSVPSYQATNHLQVHRERDAQGVVIALTGELDLASAPELDRQLRELDGVVPGRLLIDLSGLEFMDSTGIALLIRAQRSAEANGYPLALRRGPAQIEKLFEVTRLVDHFTFEDAG